jgi:hypothetical protein
MTFFFIFVGKESISVKKGMSNLYAHVAQHAFSFLDLVDLVQVHRTCVAWNGFVDRMPPVDGLASILPDAPTPLTKHVARVVGVMPSLLALAHSGARLRYLNVTVHWVEYVHSLSLLVRLEEFHLEIDQHDERGVNHAMNRVLKQLGQLTQLHTCHFTLPFTCVGRILWSRLKTCTSLRNLALFISEFHMEDYVQLRDLSQLQRLQLPLRAGQAVLFRPTFPFPRLQSLGTEFLTCSNDAFEQLPSTMTHLKLWSPDFDRFDALGRMSLVRLSLRFVTTAKSCLSLVTALEACVHLQSLSLVRVCITDEQLVRPLQSMPHLTRLVLWDMPLRSARFLSHVPNLTKLHMRSSKFAESLPPADVQYVLQLIRLRELPLEHCFSIETEAELQEPYE